MASLTEAEIQAQIDLIHAAIAALVSGRVKTYTIGRRRFERYGLGELRGMLKYYQDLMESIPTEVVTVYDDTDI